MAHAVEAWSSDERARGRDYQPRAGYPDRTGRGALRRHIRRYMPGYHRAYPADNVRSVAGNLATSKKCNRKVTCKHTNLHRLWPTLSLTRLIWPSALCIGARSRPSSGASPAVNCDLMYQAMVREARGSFNQIAYWSHLTDWFLAGRHRASACSSRVAAAASLPSPTATNAFRCSAPARTYV